MFEKPVFGRKGFAAAAQKFSDFVAGGDEFDLGGLTDELKRLDLFQRGLGRLGMRYVATGLPEDFPAMLKPIVDKGGRSSYSCPYFKDNGAVNDAHGMSDLAITKGEVTDGDILSRFLAVRRAVRPLVSQTYYGLPDIPEDEMPARELMSAIYQGDGRLNSHSMYANPAPPVVPTIGPREVVSLLEKIGGKLDTYFADQGLHAYTLFSRRPDFQQHFNDLIFENPKAFASAFDRLYYPGNVATLLALAVQMDAVSLPPVMARIFGFLGKGNAKDVRESAISTLAKLDPEILPQALELGLAEGELEMRYDLVQIAGRAGGDALMDVLRAHLPKEKSGKVEGAITAILGTQVLQETDEASEDGKTKLADGSTIAPRGVDDSLLALPDDSAWDEFTTLVDAVNRQRDAFWADKARNRQDQAPISEADARSTFAVLQEKANVADLKSNVFMDFDLRERFAGDEVRAWFKTASRPLKWRVLSWLRGKEWHFYHNPFLGLMTKRDYDRSIAEQFVAEEIADGTSALTFAVLSDAPHASFLSAEQAGKIPPSMERAMTTWLAPHRDYWREWENPLRDHPLELAQETVLHSLPAFDRALGLAPANGNFSLTQTFAMLAMLPAVPERYVAKLFELGLSGKREEREGAQKLLANANGLADRLIGALDDRRQDARGHAATWLADIRAKDAEKALRKRLKKEKAEKVRAALIEALIRLEADLSDVIGPEALVAEAEKKGGKLALPEWLSADTLPHVRFADGSAAPRSLIEYWIGLAVKLKDPGNTGLFGIYLDQLAPEDARALSGQILQGWIDYDTAAATLDEANAIANATVDTDWRRGIGYSREELFAVIVKEAMNKLNNTGTKSKGILALACRAEPAFAADRVRAFIKKHGRRSHQAMAMLDMLAGMNSPTAMQVVISAATRLKQKSTMAHANAIAERYAQDRGWSYDELADRTVPTAGFDDDGVLDLPCGEDEKPYLARIDASLAVHLYNPAGKVIKSLPTGDDEVTKESKKALSAAKRELKQIVTMQTDRLREALTNGRQWPVADWQEAFHGHPVMRRLIERLVWQGMDAEGNALRLFRATQEGDFTDAKDNEVALADFAEVRLAHAAHVDSDVTKAWRAHLKDYEIKPLLDQFPASYKPLGGEDAEATAISDRFGWVGDSLSYRGLAEKLGYSREMGDGGGCVGYTKSFPAHEITAVIVNSGSHAYDENNKVVLKELIFRHRGAYGGMKLAEVPPVLLAMCHADLHAVAKKGTYAEDWEKQVEW